MPIRNKRAALARLLRASGSLALLERLARRPGLVVLGYHRIAGPEGNPFYDGVLSAGPDEFRRQVTYLRDHFRILPIGDLPIDESREPCALITFDDGYRDNLDVAMPILAELGVPAAFFLPTDFLDRPRLFWWDKIAYILKNSRLTNLTFDLGGPVDLDLSQSPRDDAIARVVAPFLASHPDAHPAWLDQIEDRAEVSVDEAALARPLMLDWAGARALRDAGMAIGSHARTHRKLARLSQADQREELSSSRSNLERELGDEVFSLAYPFGVGDAVDAATRRLALESGYRLGFAFDGRINRPGSPDPLALSRVNVGLADTGALFRARLVLLSAFGGSFV